MVKRLFIAAGLVIAGAAGFYLALTFSRLVPYETSMGESHAYLLLFEHAGWMIPLAAFMGVLVRALFANPQSDVAFKNGKVLRHDGHMFFFHWCNALAILILADSGMRLGPGWLPRTAHTVQEVGYAMNLHFFGTLLFFFALAYIISDFHIKGTVREHLPSSGDLKDSVTYYTSKITGAAPPDQAKFLASEKLTFPLWIILFLGIALTGCVKLANHFWAVPASIMPVVTWSHDLFAFALLVLVVAHIILGALVPWSWPLLRSMVTGYMDRDYVRTQHSRWHEQLQSKTQP